MGCGSVDSSCAGIALRDLETAICEAEKRVCTATLPLSCTKSPTRETPHTDTGNMPTLDSKARYGFRARKKSTKLLEMHRVDAKPQRTHKKREPQASQPYYVDKIVSAKQVNGVWLFEVQWHGYEEKDWIPKENFDDPSLPEKFLKQIRTGPS